MTSSNLTASDQPNYIGMTAQRAAGILAKSTGTRIDGDYPILCNADIIALCRGWLASDPGKSPAPKKNECRGCGTTEVPVVGGYCSDACKDTRDSDPGDMEFLAAIEHESWAGWTRWMLKSITADLNLYRGPIRSHDLSELECVNRWRRQMETPYADLSEKEKESDRRVVRKKLNAYRPGHDRD